MKHAEVYMNLWLDFHERRRIFSTDRWYLDFVNRLVPVVRNSPLYKTETVGRQREIALFLTIYLEDCIADTGNWREFIHWHRRRYGSYLPFYSVADDYLPDEINRQDIAVILWGLNSGMDECYGTVENPFDPHLLQLADKAYELMDEFFEEAPISHALAPSWFMSTMLMEKECIPIPEATLDDKDLRTDVRLFLEATEGAPLMYFKTYGEMELFLVEKLKWEKGEVERAEYFEEAEREGRFAGDTDLLFPELKNDTYFVVYANPKGILIASCVARCFADKRNPYYDREQALKDAYGLFCRKGFCPFDLLKYAVDHNLLPDVVLPIPNGEKLFWENRDFLTRWFLEEYYEE